MSSNPGRVKLGVSKSYLNQKYLFNAIELACVWVLMMYESSPITEHSTICAFLHTCTICVIFVLASWNVRHVQKPFSQLLQR